ncbi:hypothetical protein V1478_007885 [Vespula squamosa]|uniref:Uncharacterized protein n=1 Tax=Vespula squamosa TaxID=30214 RepID=A0ABD2AY36_VESSQ
MEDSADRTTVQTKEALRGDRQVFQAIKGDDDTWFRGTHLNVGEIGCTHGGMRGCQGYWRGWTRSL